MAERTVGVGRGRWVLAACVLLALVPRGGRAQSAEVGQWSSVMDWSISATHMHLLPTGQVMFFGEFEEGLEPPRLWDPASGTLRELPRAHYNIFCAGHSYLADGRLLLTGGHVESHIGEPHTVIFNPFTLGWENGPDMNDNRWYPTNTTLPNGDVVILSGETTGAGTSNALPQIYRASTGRLHDLTTAVRDLPYYPRMFLAPNGKLFFAGPWRASLWLDVEGTGTWFGGPRSQFGGRSYGAAVMYGSKVLIIGGGSPPTNTVEEIDLSQASPTWRYRAPMRWARRQLNATLLPDGKVLVTGGSSGADFDDDNQPVNAAEVYDPATNTWTTLASAAEYRGYHATAILLPDGRVVTGGGRHETSAQVFSPPYLFQGARPIIENAPDIFRPGDRFRVTTPDAARVAKVTLLALGSTTHAFDQHQRFLSLPFSRASGALEVTAPESNIAAPPGYYMLFLVDDQGVPSVAKMVRVDRVPPRFQKKIVFSDTWRYDDRGVDQGTAWLAADFDDSAWKSGPGQFGFGDGDEGTVVAGGSASIPTVYFRKKFTLDNVVEAAELELLYDDGTAVWINGVLVTSRNVANGLGYSASASGSTSNKYERITLPLSPNPFRVGENIVTAVVKQVSPTSNDLTFALSLAVGQAAGPVPEWVQVTAPNGGEAFQPGASTSITWSSSGFTTGVDLAFSSNGGASWTPIASGVANTGVYAWTVPDVVTTQGLVRVSRAGASEPSDVSDAPFTISRQSRLLAIPYRSTWKYHDSGTDPGMHWNTAHFDDSAWKSGAGQLGYGDGDEATVLTRTTPSQTSVYFRKTLTLDGSVNEATLRVLFDDGIVVWVNGTQVFSRNVDSGIEHSRYASASAENEVAEASISTAPFVKGENIIAVMVKQTGRSSPDLSFDLELDLGVISGQ